MARAFFYGLTEKIADWTICNRPGIVRWLVYSAIS